MPSDPAAPTTPAATSSAQLREVEELRRRLAAIVESSDDAIVSWTLEGVIDSWNRSAEEIYGYRAAEVLGRPALQILASDGETREAEISELAARGQQVSHVELTRIRKDGAPVAVLVSVFAVRDEAGRIIGGCEIARNVSERKRAEQQLLATLNELKHIKAALDEHSIVAITDARGRITYVNDKFCAISRYSREELLGQDHRLINSRHHPKEFFRELWQTIEAGRVWRGEIRNRAKDGSLYWVETTIYPFVNNAGKPTQYVAIRTDISQRKEDEAKLQLFAEALAEKNKELETIVYTVSHDLRSPLVNVQGFAKLLTRACDKMRAAIAAEKTVAAEELRPVVEDSVPQALRFINAGVAKMEMLLNGLLRYSRLGRVELAIAPIEMDGLFLSILAAAKFQIDQAGATIELQKLPDAMGDLAQTSQVFANLVDNALKYRAPDRPLHLRISGAVAGARATFCVEDNGIGIPAEHQPKVFEIFHRLDPETTAGEGLGLTIAQRVLERQGGKIWVESQAGAGSRFFVSLPAANPQQ